MKDKQLLREKISEVRNKVATLTKEVVALKAEEAGTLNISLNTASTQLYQKKKELRTLQLIDSLFNDDIKLSEENKKAFILLTTLESERTVTHYDLKEGDVIIDVMMKYPSMTRKKLDDKLTKLGLKADYANNKIVKI